MEDAGAGAVVLYSLFEEQIRREREALHYYLLHGTESYAEALTYFPEPVTYHASPEQYLELIRKARESVSIPIIASLNGTTLRRLDALRAEHAAGGRARPRAERLLHPDRSLFELALRPSRLTSTFWQRSRA